MSTIFLSFYFPPDLSAGSFRATALVNSLLKKNLKTKVHVVTTFPNRYSDYKIENKENILAHEEKDNLIIHRINLPRFNSGFIGQGLSFCFYAYKAFIYCIKLKPNFIIATTGRSMTALLAYALSFKTGSIFFVDVRDIFSETISDLLVRKNRLISHLAGSFFFRIEKIVLSRAIGVNVVSKGFLDYYSMNGLDVSEWTTFPNGIDDEFIELRDYSSKVANLPKKITYAGNIGHGQALERILPLVASKLAGQFDFVVVGGGGLSGKLKERVKELNLDNFQVLPPVKRDKLIEIYKGSDILFLHLDDINAFKRVLPSKIFEYSCFEKPIVAGISGYSKNFVNDNLPDALLFKPLDVEGCIAAIIKASEVSIDLSTREKFITKYSRVSVMDKMSDHLISLQKYN